MMSDGIDLGAQFPTINCHYLNIQKRLNFKQRNWTAIPSLKFTAGIGSKYENRLVSSKALVEAGPGIGAATSIGPNDMLNECLLVPDGFLGGSGWYHPAPELIDLVEAIAERTSRADELGIIAVCPRFNIEDRSGPYVAFG